MGERKVVNRKVALGTGLLCLALLIVMGGVVANYTSALNSKDAQIRSNQNQISTLQNQNANLQNQTLTTNSTITSDNTTIKSIKTEISNLQTQITSEKTAVSQLQSQLTSAQNTLASDNSEINSFNTTSATVQIASDDLEIDSLNQNVSNLQSQISSLENSLPSVDGFSIIQITDTQYLSDSDPALFDGLTSWIANNSGALNLAMVIHTGDIVNTANSAPAWSNANTAMIQLYNADVPYCWDAGNHDQFFSDNIIGLGNPNTSWMGGNYPAFNVTDMRQQPYWVGDIFDGKNTAVKFSYGNYHFMVIDIEYDANQTVLDWMETLLQSNPNVNVIVATHNFLNGNGTYGYTLNPDAVAWATNFENILNNYPNVFMTLNGHDISDGGTAYNIKVGSIEECFFNMQEVASQTGAATARIYTFNMSDPANPVVNAYTYQTYTEPMQYLTDSLDQFSFSSNLIPYSASTAEIAANTTFLGASGYSVTFNSSITLNSFSQYGDALTFNNLTDNGVTSNFNETVLGANIVISSYNPNFAISYAVSGSGNQTFSVNEFPASVDIDGVLQTSPGNGWSYENGEITVTAATSSVVIDFL